jgi:hypothetical protein
MNRIFATTFLGLMCAAAHGGQYQIMIYEDPVELAKRADAGPAGKAYWDRFAAYGERLKAAGVLRGGAALQGSREARTVTLEHSGIKIMAGPAANGRGELGGYFVIETDTLEDAIAWAARAPSAATGGAAEIRPFHPVTGMTASRR